MTRRNKRRVTYADLSPEAQAHVRALRPSPPRPEAAQRAGDPHDTLRGATQLERRYAAWLDLEQAAGRVSWRYEPLTLVLSREGRGLRYTPDFGVVVRSCCTCSATGLVRSVNAEGVVTRVSTCGACGGRTWSDLHQRLELVEVKPRRKNGEPLWLGDSRTKVLAAAEWGRWAPWSLVLALPRPGGTFERRVL